MKSKQMKGQLVVAIAAFIMATGSYAASKPSSVTAFTPQADSGVFSVRAKGWADPAFGDMGWTHSCKWGSFHAEKGQLVKIVSTAQVKGVHPGMTVWYRGEADTAPDVYVVDTFYPQNANLVKYGITDNDTGANLGDVVMINTAYGYDQDANSVADRKLGGKKDGVNGRLVLTFRAKESGEYMFALGGFNPDPNIDATLGHNIAVRVTVK